MTTIQSAHGYSYYPCFLAIPRATAYLLESYHVNIQCVKLKLCFDRGVLNRWPGAREKSQQSQSQTANWLTNYIRETGF